MFRVKKVAVRTRSVFFSKEGPFWPCRRSVFFILRIVSTVQIVIRCQLEDEDGPPVTEPPDNTHVLEEEPYVRSCLKPSMRGLAVSC